MKKLKISLTIVTLFFAFLGITRILDYKISMPSMIVSMGAYFILSAKEQYDAGHMQESLVAVFVTIVLWGIFLYTILTV